MPWDLQKPGYRVPDGPKGFYLFESPRDAQLLEMFAEEAGLPELQRLAIEQAYADLGDISGIPAGSLPEDTICYSMYSEICTDPDVVRYHLESTSVLRRLIEKYAIIAERPCNSAGYEHPAYPLVLLGACAMSLGCDLDQEFLQMLREVLVNVGLDHRALQQMRKALNGPNGFETCSPYEFLHGSDGDNEDADMSDTGGPSAN